jgi:hypothetical protein
MVEDTVENKKGKLPRTLLMIAGGVFMALVFSVYWRINHARDLFGGNAISFPTFNPSEGINGMEDIMGQMQGQTSGSMEPYKKFSTPDGYLSFKYPPSFTDGKDVMEQAAAVNLDSSNFLLFAYKIDTSFTDMNPTTLIAAHYNATSTEEVVSQIKQALDQQQCQSDIKKTDEPAGKNTYQLFDSTYTCGNQGDLGLWQARTAVIKKNDGEFYAVTGAATSKNWGSAKLEINSVLDSISINQPAPNPAPENPAGGNGDNQTQNNETVNQ